MNLSKEQLSALDIDASCFVFASAGSGKTKVLVDRFIASLLNKVPPHKILCITFTNNAVDEMKSRILCQLRLMYLNFDGYTKKYLETIMPGSNVSDEMIYDAELLYMDFVDNFHKLKITTMHSLCQEILTKYPVEASLDPLFEIADTNISTHLMSRAIDEFMLSNQDIMTKVTRLFSKSRFMDIISGLDQIKLCYFFSKHKDLDEYRKNISELFGYDENMSSDCIIDLATLDIDKYITKTFTVRKRLSHEDSSIAERILSLIKNENKGKAIDKTMYILSITQEIMQIYERLKRENNCIDFNDLLLRTDSLLRSEHYSSFILQQLSEINSIMVDESQDLNVIHWNIIKHISYDILTCHDKRKTIFIVGDIKQSIYRFQGADYRLMLDFVEYCKAVLTQNKKKYREIIFKECHRTNEKILKVVDKVFTDRLYAFGGKYSEHITNNKKMDSCVSLVPSENFVDKILDVMRLHGNKNIMILSRARNSELSRIVDNLKSNGVDISISNKVKLYDSLIIMDIVALIEVCINQNNRYKVFCISKSEYIFEKPMTNYDISIGACSLDSGIEVLMRNEQIYTKLSRIINYYNENRFIKFIHWLFSTQLIYNKNSIEHDMMSIFFHEVIEFFKANDSIEAFILYIKTYEICTDSCIHNDKESGGNLSVHTIHGSKGMESDIVFLMDFEITPKKTMSDVIWSKSCDLFMVKPNKYESFEEVDRYIDDEIQEERHERMRLLYVAMTRAIDYLYVENCGCNGYASDAIKSIIDNAN